MTQIETTGVTGYETQRTDLKPVYRWIFELGAACLVLFYLYSAGFGSASEQYHIGFYLLVTYVLIGFLYRCRQPSPVHRPSVLDMGLVISSIFTIGYWIVEYPDLATRAGNYNQLDIFVGAIAIVISFEVSRRTVGWALPIIAMIGILYALVGRSMPDAIAHKGFSMRRIIEHSFFNQAGVFGIMANVMATYVILFIFFGAFLEKSGVGQFFINLPMSIAGRSTGGCGESLGYDLWFLRFCCRKRDSEYSRHWHIHYPINETHRIPSARCWRSRSIGVCRWAIFTTRDGRGGVPNSRTHRAAV